MSLAPVERVEKPYRFKIPTDLFPILEAFRKKDALMLSDSSLDSQPFIILYLGLGPQAFLTFDGRVIACGPEENDPCYEVIDEREACFAIVEGAQTRDASELLRLLPLRPDNAIDCHNCLGKGNILNHPCFQCGGLGGKRQENT